MVPGCEYVTFLTNVLEFLSTHPSEIVVAQIKASGEQESLRAHKKHSDRPPTHSRIGFLLPKQKLNKEGEVVALSMVPTAAELAASLAEAHKAVPKADIVIGSPKDLDLPIGTLIQSKKRFIMIDLMHDPDGWDFEDTYDHKYVSLLVRLDTMFTLKNDMQSVQHPRSSSYNSMSRTSLPSIIRASPARPIQTTPRMHISITSYTHRKHRS
jgi:hypothetical protein